MSESLSTAAKALQPELVRLRRDLHREPELGLELPRTQDKVLNALDGLPLEVTAGERLTSVTAVLRGARPGPTVLLRGDMDALPVTERGDADLISRTPGRMHACGHDLHTAMLAGSARLLAGRRDRLAGNVVFMFQPGEENAGGARIMLEEGVLDAAGERPVAAYALHVSSAVVPQGLFVSRGGPIMAAADRLRVTVRGTGGHGASPHLARDPLPAACEMVSALQSMVTRAKAADMAFFTGPDAKRFSGGAGYRVETAPAVRMFLMFNERSGHPGADEKVRRAIAQAVDPAAFGNAAALGRGERLTSIAEAAVPCVSKDASLLVKPDAAAARKALSGLKVTVAGTNAIAGGAGNTYVQAALRAAGADAELRNLDNATWSTEVLGNQGDWDVNVMAHLNLTLTMTNPASLFAGEPAPKGRNVGGVRNPGIAKGMGAALATTDETAKCEAWARAQRALLERVHAVPLTAVNTTYVFGGRVDAMLPGGLFDISTLVLK
ncbi:amidohydrolase [Actinomadura sp. 21ATH]|uniref:amidohydrolase n=1 Tax=Actinomadura sp. 21ATH TaxID=1735444 RepID=UPI0035C19BA5